MALLHSSGTETGCHPSLEAPGIWECGANGEDSLRNVASFLHLIKLWGP